MSLFYAIRVEEKIIVPAPLGLSILRLMGMVRRTTTGGYALVYTFSNKSRKDNDEPEEAMAILATSPPLEGEPVDTVATLVAHGAPFKPDPFSTRVRDRLVRLKVIVATILTNQSQILECLDRIQLTLDEDVAFDTPAAPAQDIDA